MPGRRSEGPVSGSDQRTTWGGAVSIKSVKQGPAPRGPERGPQAEPPSHVNRTEGPLWGGSQPGCTFELPGKL